MSAALVAVIVVIETPTTAAAATPRHSGWWRLGKPIVTYWAGPALTDTTAKQMAEGGFNVVWCRENELDVVQRHGLRAQLQDGLLSPAALEAPAEREKLEKLIERVRRHPAMYSYFITDEPSAGAFPALGRLVEFLRERDPAHLAYINLFPTYANNEQLGTKGDLVTAYSEHLKQYVQIVKPALISYDHYQFRTVGDGDQYFLNLSMIRDTARKAGVPFLNIVQACTWTPSMRVPSPDEMRYLVYTTLAYGAEGISYYVYCHQGHTGGIALSDGTPTPIYHALKTLNREFVAIATELQPLRSIAVYHTALKEQGCTALPTSAPFSIEQQPGKTDAGRGVLLGYFGKSDKPTHVVLVNLDYRTGVNVTLAGPGRMEKFDPAQGRWRRAGSKQIEVALQPGGGLLARAR